MALPLYDWLGIQLARVDEVGGGYHNKMANPVQAGAGFAESALIVSVWLAAVGPASLWIFALRIRRRIMKRRG